MITALLIANRGEIARRIARTAATMGMTVVAVHSDADADAPFVAEADLAVRLPGTAAADTYLRADLIVDAARRAGADAVHPGYGFLSENAGFARAVVDAGLTWVGPPPEAVAAMGSKLEAKRLMREAGVPVLDSVPITDQGEGELEQAAERVGWPVLVKASAGGGGRGMRVVREPGELGDAVESARREAGSAFGDDTVFLERYVQRPRHVEIQVLADTHGRTVSLHERECSIQRRHQKIVEEAPSPAVSAELRDRMGAAAVAAAEAVGYVGAGTVEFLLTSDGEFFFLEMNTRLQVEHPVTELVTGLDLVRLQLLVAQGAPLPDEVRHPPLSGHAVEVRLYAEDPARDWLPQTGRIERIRFDATVRTDSGVVDGSTVSPYYDPLLAKVIAWGPTRTEAAATLARSLERAELHGLTTNRALLVRTLRSADFLAGRTDTAFLERHDPAELSQPLADAEGERLSSAAAALAGQARRRATARVLAGLPSGWRNSRSGLQRATFEGSHATVEVGYALERDGLVLELDGQERDARLLAASPDRVELEIDGVARRFAVHLTDDRVYVDSVLGPAVLVEVPRYPSLADRLPAGSQVAPMPGTVVRVAVSEGQQVDSGQALVVIEAMKMEHAVTASTDAGVAEVLVAEGDQVETGQVLVVLSEDEEAAA